MRISKKALEETKITKNGVEIIMATDNKTADIWLKGRCKDIKKLFKKER